MPLQDIRSKLQQLLPGAPAVLDAALIESDEIMALLRDCLNVEAITIERPLVVAGEGIVTVAGPASLLNVAELELRAEFYEQGGAVQLRLTVALPGAWTFGQSFANLATYLSLDSLDYGYRESYLNALDFVGPRLVLASADYTDTTSEPSVTFKRGLNFRAYLGLTGLLEPLALIAGSLDALLVSGLIVAPGAAGGVDANGRRMFRLSASFPLSFGPEVFRFSNPSISLHSSFGDPLADGGTPPTGTTGEEEVIDLSQIPDPRTADDSRIEIGVQLEIAGHVTDLFFPFRIGAGLNFAAIGLRTPSLGLPGLGEIAALVGDADLEGALPASLGSFGGLTIAQFVAGVSIAERRLAYVLLDLRTTDTWRVVPQIFEIQSLAASWLIDAPLDAQQHQIACAIDGQLKIAGVDLEVHAELPDFLISGWLAVGSTIKVGALLSHLIPGIAPTDDQMVISQLDLLADPKYQTFSLATQIDNVWPIPLGFTDLEITSLTLALDYAPQGVAVKIAGDLQLLGVDWLVEAERPSGGSWTFAGQLGEQEPVGLLDLVDEFVGKATAIALPKPDFLQGLVLADLAFTVDTGSSKTYSFQGALRWDFEVVGIQLSAFAQLKIHSWLPADGRRQSKGQISGGILLDSFDIDFFKHFAVIVTYEFERDNKDLIFSLRKGDAQLNARFQRAIADGRTDTIIHVDFGTSTFGDILTFLVQLVDPGIEEFTLDPPWDELGGLSLRDLRLTVNLTAPEKTATISFVIPAEKRSLIGGLVTLERIDLTYKRVGGRRTVMIGIVGSILGKRYDENNPRSSWDAMNQPPPTIPGRGRSLFDLQYLGLGQHIALQNDPGLDTITKVMNALRAAVVDLPDKNANPLALAGDRLRFDASSGWMVGAQFMVIDTISLTFIFNDPLIYGLRIALSGPTARIFGGLAFEILYRRINDTIGVYHIELVLPDAMRQLEFGAVSITLPVVVIDIYTNGDFRLDVGFPWRGDFTRSFSVQVFPFIGSGGFYFNKLSSATATSVPAVSREIGIFSPVIEFGIGLRIGLGKAFNKGALRAELSISIEGVLEGVIGWFTPAGATNSTDQYYMVRGGAGIVGRLWGQVNFRVIQVTVELVMRTVVVFTVEAYRPIYITMTIEVSVRASIKIGFVRLRFSFRLTITQSFKLGSTREAPWDRRLPSSPAVLGELDAAIVTQAAGASSQVLRWQPVALGAKKPITIYFQPAFTRDDAGVRGVALLWIENSMPLDAQEHADIDAAAADMTSDFDELAQALLAWAIRAHPATSTGEIAITDLETLYELFIHDREDGAWSFDLANLSEFLRLNFDITITDRPIGDSGELSGTLFPMFPQLTIKPGGAAEVSFATANPLSAADRRRFADYYGDLRVGHGSTVEPDTTAVVGPGLEAALSAASFFFVDYFALLVRSVIQSAIDYLGDNNRDRIPVDDLLGALNHGGQLSHLAGMASRFMLHGLRLPYPDGQVHPLYEVTKQQFALPAATHDTKYAITLSKSADGDWLTFIDFVNQNSSTPDAPTLEFFLTSDLVKLIKALDTATAPLPTQPLPSLLPFYKDEPRRYNLHHKTDWQAMFDVDQPAMQTMLFDLPEALSSSLQRSGAAGAVFTVNRGKPRAGSTELRPQDIQPLRAFAWATRVSLSVRRVPAPGGGTSTESGDDLLGQTYLMVGTDEASKGLLEDLWTHLQSTPATVRLYLLYPSAENAKRLVNQIAADVLLLKTNLSTESNPRFQADPQVLSAAEPETLALPSSYAATLDDGANFIRLLWEGSTVNSGGYYVYYAEEATSTRGLPAHIFADGLSASLQLLVLLQLPNDIKPARGYHFHNCLAVQGEVDLAENVLFAQSADTANLDTLRVLTVPLGNIGFRLERSNQPPSGATDAEAELYRLYHMLGYRLRDTATFSASNEGLPVGPADDDPAIATDDNLWIYERMVPVYRFATDRGLVDVPDLPSAAANPYAGIRKAAGPGGAPPELPAAALEFYWQDVYGNRLSQSADMQQTLPVRYFDPLLGINQWPTVAESYSFKRVANRRTVILAIELVFDPHPYQSSADQSSTETMQRISAARAAYERIYYQIHQPDVGFTLRTSVLPEAHYEFGTTEKAQLTGFVDAAYRYLRALEQSSVARPPAALTIAVELETIVDGRPAYPAAVIFPVSVQIEMTRDPDLVDKTLGVPEVQKITAALSPKTTQLSAENPESEIVSLRQFAADFEDALDGLHLAVGSQQPHKHSRGPADEPEQPATAPLWAVHLGATGISYNIQESLPFFFTPAPLANTLLAGTVEIDVYESGIGLSGAKVSKRVEALDLNVLAHNFLEAVEAFLNPALVVPAMRRDRARNANTIDRILDHKRTLAEAIKQQVTHILAQTDDADISGRRAVAAEMLHQRLLIHLVEAYDIETIIQYNVDVALAEGRELTSGSPPRLFGQPVVQNVLRTSTGTPIDSSLLNFTLSTAKAPLSPGHSYLTFFFNTKSPQQYEDLTLELVYRVHEIEHDIVDVAGINDYQASTWLSFILPIDRGDPAADDPAQNPNHIGKVAIPIPLRTYPIPPSLVMHAAEADPDSLERLEDIRQWQYTYVYEHLDVAQDSIETGVRYNVASGQLNGNRANVQVHNSVPPGIQPLFEALVNFADIYPRLAPDLQGLTTDEKRADAATDVLAALVGRVATAWKNADIAASPAPSAHDAQFSIAEVTTAATKEVTVARTSGTGSLPDIMVPGYRLIQIDDTLPQSRTYHLTKKTPEESANDRVYGESSIPDRKLTLPDLDIISQQNAWGAIWLTRNQDLISGWRTNPVFIFQTPQISFTNKLMPLLVNTQPWYIDTIGSPDGGPQTRNLDEHIATLFATLLPVCADRAYDLRVACSYGFALAVDEKAGTSLRSTLPVLLGSRFTIPADTLMLAATESFREQLVDAIRAWRQRYNPLETKGIFVFSVALFSDPGGTTNGDTTSQPLLRIEDLRLRLEYII